MIETNTAYKAAIVGDSRKSLARAIINIIDPDIVYGAVTSSGETIYSKPEEIRNMVLDEGTPFATLELNRWVLDGGLDIAGENVGEIGFQSSGVFNDDAEGNLFVELQFSGVDLLQACSVYFTNNEYDGFPVDFTVEIKQGGTVYHTETYTDNTERAITVRGFTVYNPDAIRVTVTRWSLPNRRLRVIEIIPGVHEDWGNDMLAEFGIVHQGNFSGVALPYGTCTLRMDNVDKRFEPRNKSGLFLSIEDRQEIEVYLGVRTKEGAQYVSGGRFYQFSGGWQTGDNGLTMQWSLVDIIGLLFDRRYNAPDTLPTTLEGWVASIVGQLGEKFEEKYIVDPDYATIPCTVLSKEAVNEESCGQLLMWLAQITKTWPRADAQTGYLKLAPLKDEGGILDLDNLSEYPVIMANNDVARIDITLSDDITTLSVNGTSPASPNTISVNNPFIHTEQAAREVARFILASYGGNQIETKGRGNPSNELGDAVTVQLDKGNATVGRIVLQDFSFTDGIMKDCKTRLIQPNGWDLYQQRILFTESGTWTAPAGISSLFVILGQGGQGGMAGQDGLWNKESQPGVMGRGGLVWFGTVPINPQQTLTINIGSGGAASAYGTPGDMGEHTTLESFTSANGAFFENGYIDILGGDTFSRSGVKDPQNGTGDGGKGGRAGEPGITGLNSRGEPVILSWPTPGEPGKNGASGFAIIYYE